MPKPNGNYGGGHITHKKESMMRYRIYFRHDDTGEESVREVEADGFAYRICDDHGRVVFGEPWPKKDYVVFTGGFREPRCF